MCMCWHRWPPYHGYIRRVIHISSSTLLAVHLCPSLHWLVLVLARIQSRLFFAQLGCFIHPQVFTHPCPGPLWWAVVKFLSWSWAGSMSLVSTGHHIDTWLSTHHTLHCTVTYIRIIYSNSYLKCDFRRLNLLVVGYYKAYWHSHFTPLLFDWLFERMKIYIEDLSFVSKRHIFGPKNQPRRFFQNSELNAAGIYKSYTIFCNPMIFCGSIQILHRKIYIGVEKLAWKWSQFLLKLQRNLQI